MDAHLGDSTFGVGLPMANGDACAQSHRDIDVHYFCPYRLGGWLLRHRAALPEFQGLNQPEYSCQDADKIGKVRD